MVDGSARSVRSRMTAEEKISKIEDLLEKYHKRRTVKESLLTLMDEIEEILRSN